MTASVSLLGGQTWRRVGGSAVETGLAGAAGGPVEQIWFSADGGLLFARTARGVVYETPDFETWSPAPASAKKPQTPPDLAALRLPELPVTLRAAGNDHLYAFGRQVYLSRDDGRSWTNLTAVLGHSIIGESQHDLAVSPVDSQLVAVANSQGVWVSHDGGLSWTGANEGLPNLPVRGLLPGGGIRVDGIGTAAFEGRAGWVKTSEPVGDQAALSLKLAARITAVAGAGDIRYAGAADGRIWTSADSGSHWVLAGVQAAGAMERFTLDPDAPRIAIAVSAGRGAHVFRTVNAGQTWDDLTGLLTDVPAHGAAIDRAAGVVYVATDRGVFQSNLDLNVIGPASAWANRSAGLPEGAVEDVQLNAAGQLRVAVDGWGVYVARAPHRNSPARVLNAADLSARAAAPGGLISVPGVAVDSASASGLEYPVLARGATGSQLQVPFGTGPGEVQVELNRTMRAGFNVKAVSPAIFIDQEGAPLLVDPETGMMLDPAQALHAGSSIQILLTGLGRVKPEWPSGIPAPASAPPVVEASVTAYLNSMPLEVTRAVLAPGYVGMYLVELQIPALVNAGEAEFYIAAGGETSNRVRIQLAN